VAILASGRKNCALRLAELGLALVRLDRVEDVKSRETQALVAPKKIGKSIASG
jgi:hypothetical protein